MEEISYFKSYLSHLGYSKSSVLMLPACVKSFFDYCPKVVENITKEDVLSFYHYLQQRPHKRQAGGLSERYIHHHMYALKVFFAWQEESAHIKQNPMSLLQFKSPESKAREVLTKAEIQLLFQVSETARERAMLALFYGCGLRRVEGERLNLSDLHFRDNVLYVRAGKGGKRRAVPMSLKVRELFLNYIYQERAGAEKEAFILNKRGRRCSGESFNRLLKELVQRTNITKVISLHCLRHSIATHLLESGLSLEYVRDFLGHAHLESTQIYTRIKQQQLWHL